ncbi:hydrogen peroxide-dependent heme synthase [Alicyclobacillus ferrooxydans]|uniref:Coproheme decarboxylase n=1 Tax=Alicyclobacillus ferrooxydans TaxID=471514 RepID=A0A0P9EKZ2_9BACL|nr:hydrogen peroxide-dependent heme synthase [Alicyclobacillus ferrooxydans]KPV43872.1 heme peroxidase [Alicyclobacillus ferrooxydans]
MSEAVETLDGWYAFHDFRTIDWASWKLAGKEVREQAIAELLSFTEQCQADQAQRKGSFGQYAVTGTKADFLWIHMRETVDELTELKLAFQKTLFADFTEPVYSYTSCVELSSYLAKPGVDVDTDPYLQSRLKPVLPDNKYVCFYPMNKRRAGEDNWYMLSRQERGEMMKNHGLIGRKYAGKVTQIITGSQGLDDWEWGVTLYSDDVLQFKKLVYEMRFDETSARFADFGPFYIGSNVTGHALQRMLTI